MSRREWSYDLNMVSSVCFSWEFIHQAYSQCIWIGTCGQEVAYTFGNGRGKHRHGWWKITSFILWGLGLNTALSFLVNLNLEHLIVPQTFSMQPLLPYTHFHLELFLLLHSSSLLAHKCLVKISAATFCPHIFWFTWVSVFAREILQSR